MRIIVEVPDEQAAQALAAIQKLGYPAQPEEIDIDLDEVERSHIEEILRREQDPEMSNTKSWEEIRQKYIGRGL